MSIKLPNSYFIHIPRTGGTWFQQSLIESNIPFRILKGDIDSHFTNLQLSEYWDGIPFTFVRHPWDWVKSRWSHAIKHGLHTAHRHYGIHRRFDRCVRPSFSDTIEELLLEFHSGVFTTTFEEMTKGSKRVTVLRLEDFPSNLSSLISSWEGSKFHPLETKINGTTEEFDDSKYEVSLFLKTKYLRREELWMALHGYST